LSGSGGFRTGRTPFDQLTIVLKFTQGTASVEEVRLEGAAIHLALAGTASIPERNVDLTGTASLATPAVTGQDPPFELPFVVNGSWDLPEITPDIQTLIQRSRATAPLLDAVKDRKTREAVQSAIDRLTGTAPVATQANPPAAVTPAATTPATAAPAAGNPVVAPR
jgi:AsmA protein